MYYIVLLNQKSLLFQEFCYTGAKRSNSSYSIILNLPVLYVSRPPLGVGNSGETSSLNGTEHVLCEDGMVDSCPPPRS